MRPAARDQGDIVLDTALFAQVLDPANRADPYRLYAHLRETPILRDEDGTYIVSTYAEIRSLLQDSRVSSRIFRYLSVRGRATRFLTLSSIRSRTGSLKRIVPCCFATLPITASCAA